MLCCLENDFLKESPDSPEHELLREVPGSPENTLLGEILGSLEKALLNEVALETALLSEYPRSLEKDLLRSSRFPREQGPERSSMRHWGSVGGDPSQNTLMSN